MPCFLVPLHESNDCHNPGGSPEGGRFCSSPEGLATVKIVRRDAVPRPGHPEARYVPDNKVELYEKFFKLDREQQGHVLTHEIGHWFRDRRVPLDDIMGFEPGEKFFDLFAAGDSEEGFAEAFMVYVANPSELKQRYPSQFTAMQGYVSDDDVRAVKAWVQQTLETHAPQRAPRSQTTTDTLSIRAKSKAALKAMVTSYGLTLKTATKDEDGSWVVAVTGGRSEIEHLTRDTEG